ncbi:MAG: methyltransferase [Anaerolineaceae bacterium]|nr:methyltransferase [Anaerolineaceae bacterium]NTV36715.1 methyltransferase [Anaerolineaceae bacterium]
MPLSLTNAQKAEFNEAVWKIARQIPEGTVFTYGQIAELIPLPKGMPLDSFLAFRARWVGTAMAACPEDVPWQRVINAQGMISVREGSQEQRRLLEEDGVVFNERQRVDLKVYGWQGPTQEWLQENGLQAN